jgi:hypothetical protein
VCLLNEAPRVPHTLWRRIGNVVVRSAGAAGGKTARIGFLGADTQRVSRVPWNDFEPVFDATISTARA